MNADTGRCDGPLGLFDSGVGGLSVVRALLQQLPRESLLYVADTAHCPYGSRSTEEIRTLSVAISRYLIEDGCKLIVVACNTASAAALAHLRQTFPETPFVGMVPAVKPAAAITRSGVVGVLATPVTFQGALYEELVSHYGREVRLLSRACPGLVERIEQGDLDSPALLDLLRGCVEPMLQAGADTLVLGCTHYPFIAPALRRLLGEDVAIVEPSDAIARQTARVLEREGLVCSEAHAPSYAYQTSGALAPFAAAAPRLLGVVGAGQVSSVHWRGDVLEEGAVGGSTG
jgi:glutamate racemase